MEDAENDYTHASRTVTLVTIPSMDEMLPGHRQKKFTKQDTHNPMLPEDPSLFAPSQVLWASPPA
jgi:hypothetical protein